MAGGREEEADLGDAGGQLTPRLQEKSAADPPVPSLARPLGFAISAGLPTASPAPCLGLPRAPVVLNQGPVPQPGGYLTLPGDILDCHAW